MSGLLWIILPLFVAAGSGLLAFIIMQSRLEVAVAKGRESLADAEATLRSLEKVSEEKVRAAEQATLRRAFDEFLGDLRVEERHYTRERKSLFASRKSLILQERLYFRNIPLSNWVEHEMVVEEGGDLRSLAQRSSIFASKGLPGADTHRSVRLLGTREEDP